MDSTALIFSDTKVGMTIVDGDGDEGIITDNSDIHNIHIRYTKYDNKLVSAEGVGLICLDPECAQYERIYKKLC